MITSEITISPSLFDVLKRTGLFAIIILVAGCATVSRPVGVTSPPPPVVGSAPITAYDDYAQTVVPTLEITGKALAVIVPASSSAPLMVAAAPGS